MSLSINCEYSDAEKKLFSSLKLDKLMEFFNPITLYQYACIKCFKDDISGNDVDALRRGMIAIDACKMYRMTKEFDDLISFNTLYR